MHDTDLSTLHHELPADAFLDVAAAADYAVDGVAPLGVVFPASVEDVSTTLRWANAHKLAVWPRGSGSKLSMGNVPPGAGLVVCLERLHQLIDHVPGDLTATMQTGLRLKALQELLRPSNQWLSIDPPFVDEATIGGILATASAGPRQYLHGRLRDLVLGATLVLPDGTVTHTGGRVVKNVMGYDLAKLYIGSLGSLGVLVECTCKLKPLPLHENVLLMMVQRLDDACEILRRIRSSSLIPSALDLLSPLTLRLLTERANLEPASEANGLLIGLEGTQGELHRSLQEIAGTHARGLTNEWIVLDGLDVGMIWNLVRDFAKILASFERPFFVASVSLQSTDLASFISATQDDLRAAGYSPYLAAHAGNGEVRVAALYGEGEDEAAAACVQRTRRRAVAAGGCLTLDHAAPAFKQHCDAWGEVGESQPLMRALKQQYDPHGMLNPGRFVGGL